MIRRDIFLQAKGFDEKFFLYLEDVDLSWRLRLLGYRLGFAPEAEVAHFFSGSAGNASRDDRNFYYCHRNLLRTILKNCGSSLGWALRNYFLFSLIVAVGYLILNPTKGIAVVRGILWNVLNFRDTYRWRVKVQFNRTTGDTEILARMYPALPRYQPADHLELRRILNTLFEHSQQSRSFYLE